MADNYKITFAEGEYRGSAFQGGPRKFKCDKGHAWVEELDPTQPAGQVISFNVPGQGWKGFCLRCIVERLEELCGTVEEVK